MSSYGYSKKLLGVTQIDNKLLITYTGTNDQVYWTLADFFTHRIISTGKVSGNLSDAGVSTVAIGDSVFVLQKGKTGDDGIYLSELRIENDQVTMVSSNQLEKGKWDTQSTPSMCSIGNMIYVVYRSHSGKHPGCVHLGAYGTINDYAEPIELPEHFKTNTGPVVVPVTDPTSPVPAVRLLMAWSSKGSSGCTTTSMVFDPIHRTFGNQHSIATTGSCQNLCLRAISNTAAVLAINGKACGNDPPEVFTYKVEGEFAGKWTPNPKQLKGLQCTETPCVLPYSRRDADQPNDDSVWLLAFYSRFSDDLISYEDFNLSQLS